MRSGLGICLVDAGFVACTGAFARWMGLYTRNTGLLNLQKFLLAINKPLFPCCNNRSLLSKVN
jgi:hypothetical protein